MEKCLKLSIFAFFLTPPTLRALKFWILEFSNPKFKRYKLLDTFNFQRPQNLSTLDFLDHISNASQIWVLWIFSAPKYKRFKFQTPSNSSAFKFFSALIFECFQFSTPPKFYRIKFLSSQNLNALNFQRPQIQVLQILNAFKFGRCQILNAQISNASKFEHFKFQTPSNSCAFSFYRPKICSH